MSKSIQFQYRSNPDLPSVKPDYPGNKFANGRFYNDSRRKHPVAKDAFQWKFKEGNPQKQEKRNDKFRVPVIPNKDVFQGTEDVIVWLGHASFFIRINGVNLLTDPCLGDIYLLRRLVGLPCDISDIFPIDYILLSHGHRDHFDVPSLKKLLKHNPKVRFLCPLNIGSLIRKNLGKQYVYQEAGWYQTFTLPQEDIQITALPAKHWNRRGLSDYNLELWCGYWIQANNKKLYFSGDTADGPHFQEIHDTLGSPDIAFMPIGAYKPAIIMNSSHTSPQESVAAFNLLGGKTFIPMHYATYDLSDEPISEPIRLCQQMESDGTLKGKLANLAVGEELKY